MSDENKNNSREQNKNNGVNGAGSIDINAMLKRTSKPARERIIRRVERAIEADTAVVKIRVPETFDVVRILNTSDAAIDRLRKGMNRKYDIEKCLSLLTAYDDAVSALDKATSDICDEIGFTYKALKKETEKEKKEAKEKK
ncbi:MAG: hypothetical protein OEY64_12480 [Nitrospinota bacterium]|nr:hypothetical protein [Nitrospinota bacterium]